MKRSKRPSSYWKTYRNIRARLDKTVNKNSDDVFEGSSVETFAEWFFEDKYTECEEDNAGEEIKTLELVETPCKNTCNTECNLLNNSSLGDPAADNFVDDELDDLPPLDSDDYDSDIDTNEADENLLEQFLNKISQWSLRYNLSRDCFNDLLNLLIASKRFKYSELPKDCRTLLKTPKKLPPIDNIEGGQFVYFGIESQLKECMSRSKISCTAVRIDVNIDGLPLRQKSPKQFWPILCSVVGYDSPPLMVALYYGKEKPRSLSSYLQRFTDEYLVLQQNGFYVHGVHVTLSLRCFICDAPARSFIKCTISHNGKHGCERCCIVGKSVNKRVVFVAEKFEDCFNDRTNDEFRSGKYNGKHVKTVSPLQQFSQLDIVRDIVLDPMHLIYLGVCRRYLFYLKSGPLAIRLSASKLGTISERLISCAKFTPTEFARKPRSLFELEYWKATEYRQFLLYTGVVALRGIISDDCYQLFLSLSVAIRILNIKEDLKRNKLIPFAKRLLKAFVWNAEIILGTEFITYNVHSIIHLPDDVIRFGCCLEEISSFKFENHLYFLKKQVSGSRNKPLESVIKRTVERARFSSNIGCYVREQHKLHLSPNVRDRYFINQSGSICKIIKTNGIAESKKFECIVFKMYRMETFYDSPIVSSKVGIVRQRHTIKHAGRSIIVNAAEVKAKVYAIPFKDDLVFVELLHSD